MKKLPLVSAFLTSILAISSPVFAHVGHGDEFQSKGGIERVQVNAATDQQLGIVVTPISQSATGVVIPITALVEADGKQLVFVQYENFYEPVPVTTGKTQGEGIEITQGLSAGEKLVTQGSLSLYAQSRKTQKSEPVISSQTANPSVVATAISTPQTTNPNIVATTTSQTTDDNQGSRLLVGGVVVGGSLLAMLGGAIYVLKNRKSSRKKKRDFSANDRGDV